MAPSPFPPIALLRDVRGICLEHSATRRPRWLFLPEPDLALSIQPQLAYFPTPAQVAFGIKAQVVRFECVAVIAECDVVATMLTDPPWEFPPKLHWWRREFAIIGYDGEEHKRWNFEKRGMNHARRAPIEGIAVLDKRIMAVLRGKFFSELTPASMLSPCCWICGRSLSDPVSMSRGIGAECFGSSSVVMPFMIGGRR
jgi:hypothetical protein